MASDFKVSLPLLPGHGAGVNDLDRITWREWYETVRAAYVELRRDVEKVYLAGLSLGSLLGLKLAMDEGWGIRALALMGLPLKFAFGVRAAIGAIRYSPLHWIVHSIASKWELNVAKPESRELYGQFAPSRVSLHAVYQVMDLQKTLQRELHKISNPLLLLYGKRDVTAPPFNATLARKLVSSDVVETKFFERSRHVLTIDWDEKEVKESILDFFLRFR